MPVDETLLRSARTANARWVDGQQVAALAKADYHHAIRRLHFAGASLREIADALDLSHQRVHQIIEATGGTQGWKPRKVADVDPVCSFCGLPEAAVPKLICGPGVYVCSACVALAQRAVAESVQVETDRTRVEVVGDAGTAHCSFCGRPAAAGGHLVSGPGVRICDRCLQLCDEIIVAAG